MADDMQDRSAKRRELARKLYRMSPSVLCCWKKANAAQLVSQRFWDSDITGDYLVISGFPNMPKVIDALGFLPDGTTEVCLVDKDNLEANAEAQEVLERLVDAGAVILSDERGGGKPLVRTVPGSVRGVSPWLDSFHYEAELRYVADEEISGELACSLLKSDFLFVCRDAYEKLTQPDLQRKKPKAPPKTRPKMASISRCQRFAILLSLERSDYLWFVRSDNWKRREAGALIDVEFPRMCFPEELRLHYDELVRLKDIVQLWKSALGGNGEFLELSYSEIDDGSAKELMTEVGRRIGIAEIMDAYEAGVPVDDIIA